MKNASILRLALLLIIVGAFFIFSFLNRQESPWKPAVEDRHSSALELWSKQGIYIEPNNQSLLTTVGDKLIYIGSDAPNDDPFHVIAIDKRTGNSIWQYGNGNEVCLATSDPLVFVGGVGKVTALNVDNGEVVWSTNLPWTRSVTKLLVRDSILYADTVSENHFLINTKTGEILQSISYTTNDVPIWSDHKMNLEFVGNVMYFQKKTGLLNDEVEIIATDELSGNRLWNTTVPAISRIAANSLGVYVLTLDGKVLELAPVTGESYQLIQFTPAPTPRYYSERGTAWELGYYVAVDSNNQLLFVYFEDSTQLFAYRLPIAP